jgi:probable O-glycosylation ligase (exosortase A-associated)
MSTPAVSYRSLPLSRNTAAAIVAVPALPAVADEPPSNWDLLLVCVAGYILVAVGRVHQLFPVLSAVHPAIVAGLLAMGLYASDGDARRRAALLRGRVTKCLIVLLAWMMLSVAGALSISNSFTQVFDNFLKTFLMYIVIAGAVRDGRDVERLAVTYLGAATLYGFIILSRFELGSGDAWRLGHLYYYDANDVATFIVSAMPLGLYVAHSGRHLVSRFIALGALGILTIALVHTGSRGGFVALVAVAAFVLCCYKAIAFRSRLSAFVLVTLVLFATASEQYWTQMGTILSDSDYNQTAESGRLQIWERGVGYMLRYPLFGVGPGNFPTAEGLLSPFAERQQFGIGVRWNAAHSSFVQIGAETGVVGLTVFLVLLASAFAALRHAGRAAAAAHDARVGELGQALTASLIGFVVGAAFLSLAYSEMLYTLVALAVGLRKVIRAEADQR